MKHRKKRKTAKNGSFRALVFAVIVFCVWLFSTFTLTTTEVEIPSEKVRDEITIVQLSDLHGSNFGMNNSLIFRRVEKVEPDFVVVTGDMYTHGSEEGRKVAEKLIKKLAEKYTVCYVNGEHDNDEDFFEVLRGYGVHVLDYKYEDFTIGKTSVRFYGITNVYYSPTFDLRNEFTLDESKYNVLLAHINNKEAFSLFGPDLCLSGDTHGGQIRLPIIGGLYGTNGWLPEAVDENAFVKGLYKYENTSFFISSGLGNYPLPLRFFNRPEIAVIKLIPTK